MVLRKYEHLDFFPTLPICTVVLDIGPRSGRRPDFEAELLMEPDELHDGAKADGEEHAMICQNNVKFQPR